MRRSTVTDLPPDVFDDFKKRLIIGRFKNYTAHAQWLKGLGFQISRSALARFGKRVQEELEATEKVAEERMALLAAFPEYDHLEEVSLLLASDDLNRVLRENKGGLDPKSLHLVIRSLNLVGQAQAIRQRRVDSTKKTTDPPSAEKPLSQNTVDAIREVFQKP